MSSLEDVCNNNNKRCYGITEYGKFDTPKTKDDTTTVNNRIRMDNSEWEPNNNNNYVGVMIKGYTNTNFQCNSTEFPNLINDEMNTVCAKDPVCLGNWHQTWEDSSSNSITWTTNDEGGLLPESSTKKYEYGDYTFKGCEAPPSTTSETQSNVCNLKKPTYDQNNYCEKMSTYCTDEACSNETICGFYSAKCPN